MAAGATVGKRRTQRLGVYVLEGWVGDGERGYAFVRGAIFDRYEKVIVHQGEVLLCQESNLRK